jgi:hypothetical protein
VKGLIFAFAVIGCSATCWSVGMVVWLSLANARRYLVRRFTPQATPAAPKPLPPRDFPAAAGPKAPLRKRLTDGDIEAMIRSLAVTPSTGRVLTQADIDNTIAAVTGFCRTDAQNH